MTSSESKLRLRFRPSEPCSCDICRNFCSRPGWWLVTEAREAIVAGYAKRMMLEYSPSFSFGILSPAFKGNEANYALSRYSKNGCTFFVGGKCSLHGKPYQPLECRFCHHERLGTGSRCHEDIGNDWDTAKGKRLVRHWLKIIGMKDLSGFGV